MVQRQGKREWEEASDWDAESTTQNFMWWRPRMLGGRTNHWGRIALRMGPYDFKPRDRDGLGIDWPMTYEDMAPWYDKTEELIGVWGSNEGLENTPDSPPGVLQPPPEAARLRAADEKGLRQARHPGDPIASGDPHQADQWARGLLLRDGLRARLRDQGEFSIDDRAAAAGDRDRAISTSLPMPWCGR